MSERYRRQVTLNGFGQAGQDALAHAHVAVIGAGGLGSPALLYLAAAGVGRITLIDDDTVSLSNLHRQVIHTTDRVGEPKVNSARTTMAALNPEVEVNAVEARLTWPGAIDVLRGADVVLDGSDNFDTRHVVSYACAQLGIPHVYGSILGFEAQLSVFHAGHGPVYEDLFPAPPAPGAVPSCAQAGVLGPVVGVVGSAMAMEAIKLITGIGTPLRGTLGYYDSLTGRWEYIPLGSNDMDLSGTPPRQELPQVREVDAVPEAAVLIDVREPAETTLGIIPGAQEVPLATVFNGWTPARDSGLVVTYCATGVRSAQAAEALQARGFEAASLRGGYERWKSLG
ncbi:ThiF family adenylyltransferase [Corynebacterium tapiri]|uniref:Molybdopterin biosynthesis protein MoeB n=1 Tax=Corynebacterium tapiri TaxID=1448266 RepID=A0A5C4U4V7_9CORY|nr:ThiF family adenylyltransferase [Corynebacterium tapiri]TNL97403.1 molybdopterin biosynthesis protein MoeB [Corynebacterium tapiri]